MALIEKLEPNAVLDCTTQDDWGCIYATPVRIDVKGQPYGIKFSDCDPMYLHAWTRDFKEFTWKEPRFDNNPRLNEKAQDVGSICNAMGRYVGPVIVRAAVLNDGRIYINDHQEDDEQYLNVAFDCLFEKARELFVPR